jgi:nitroreductase
MRSELESLLDVATRAPSGDNTQPWRFDVDAEEGLIEFAVDQTRDPSPMNAGQRMARIALGAAVENLLRAAEVRGLEARLESVSTEGRARVRLARGSGSPAPITDDVKAILARVTNRRVYDCRPVPPEVLARLAEQTPPLDGTVTHWIVGEDRLKPLAEVIGRADAAMFGEPSMRRAFLSKVRFDLPPGATAEDGLPLASLEASRMDRFALRLMPWLPNWLLKFSGGLSVFVKKARRLVESAAGLCVVVAPDGAPATDLAVGRAMQRAWVAISEHDLAAQPMMSLPVLENVLENGSPTVVASVGRETIPALSAAFRSLLPEVGTGRPAWLMRFGYAPPPGGRTGRLPLSAVVRELSPAT